MRKTMTVAMLAGALSLATLLPGAAHAAGMKLTCTIQTYAHSGFSNQSVMQSWFPKTTTHRLNDGKAQLAEQGFTGTYTERSGRIRIVYSGQDTEGNTLDLIYTFIRKTNVFTVRLAVGADYMSNAGTSGQCKVG